MAFSHQLTLYILELPLLSGGEKNPWATKGDTAITWPRSWTYNLITVEFVK